MRAGFAVAATGLLLVLATGTAGGAPSWQRLPAAPIPGRIAAAAVWTGSEMVVWGGARLGARSDGAAYDPARRAWRRIAAPPAGLAGGGSAAAWTGSSLVVFASASFDRAGAAAYDLRRNTWRRLPAGPLGPRESYVSVWTGRELLVFGGNRGDRIATPTAAALDPRTGSWRVLQAFSSLRGLMPTGAVWTGHEVFVAGTPRGGRGTRLYAFDPAAGGLRRIGLPAAAVRPVGFAEGRLVFTRSADTLFSSTVLRLYVPATGRWSAARPAPCALPARTYTQSAWIGDRFVAACGADAVQVYTPRTNVWRILRTGPSPLTTLGWGTIVWTGRELIAWSGTVFRPHNPMPNTGASIVLG